MAKTRVLVAEDSLTVRMRLVEILRGDPEIELVGLAQDGKQAIELCGGNIARAAAMLEIDASTIYRRRRDWAKQAAERAGQ